MQTYSDAQSLAIPIRETNGLGMVGFVVSLLGLAVPTGAVSLLGLLISLVALSRAPRGFASAGVFVGLLGAAFWLIVLVLALAVGMLAALVGAVVFAGVFMLTQPEVIEVTTDMANLALGIQYYERQEKAMPEALDDLGLGVATLTDPWGNRYRYVLASADAGFDVWSSGQDGEFETDDDLALSRLPEIWEHAFATFELKTKEFCEKLQTLQDEGKSPFPFCTEQSQSAYKRYHDAAAGVHLPVTHN